MLDYYNQLYEEYVTPIIKKEMEDIPFVLIVRSSANLSAGQYGAEYEAVIPTSLDDENSIFKKSQFVFSIYIPYINDDKKVSDLCKRISNSLTKENYYSANMVLLHEEDFENLTNAKDKYREYKKNNNYLEKKTYRVE